MKFVVGKILTRVYLASEYDLGGADAGMHYRAVLSFVVDCKVFASLNVIPRCSIPGIGQNGQGLEFIA